MDTVTENTTPLVAAFVAVINDHLKASSDAGVEPDPLGSAFMDAICRVYATAEEGDTVHPLTIMHALARATVEGVAYTALMTHQLTGGSPAVAIDTIGRDAKMTVIKFKAGIQ